MALHCICLSQTTHWNRRRRTFLRQAGLSHYQICFWFCLSIFASGSVFSNFKPNKDINNPLKQAPSGFPLPLLFISVLWYFQHERIFVFLCVCLYLCLYLHLPFPNNPLKQGPSDFPHSLPFIRVSKHLVWTCETVVWEWCAQYLSLAPSQCWLNVTTKCISSFFSLISPKYCKWYVNRKQILRKICKI